MRLESLLHQQGSARPEIARKKRAPTFSTQSTAKQTPVYRNLLTYANALAAATKQDPPKPEKIIPAMIE